MSTIALHLTLNISDTVRDRGWFQRTTNRKWHMDYQMVTWPMTSRDPKGAARQYGRLSRWSLASCLQAGRWITVEKC